MSDDPVTRNTIEAEAKRLAEAMLKTIGNDAEWRTAQAMAIAHNAARLEHLLFIVEQHMVDDRREFQEIKANARSISSSVNAEQLSTRYTLKEMFGALVAAFVAIGGLITYIAWLFPGAKP